MIRAVLFDFDGTLTRPEAIDFSALRTLLDCPQGTPILEYIETLPSPEEQQRAHRILEEFELAAARASVPNDGAEELVAHLQSRGIARGILSRNSRSSVQVALANFSAVTEADFSVILTRENAGRPKPYPDGVLGAARLFGVPPAEILVVGDFVFDIAAGNAAGARTALITNGRAAPPIEPAPDFTVARLGELREILDLPTLPSR
jgi:HAD superfamily hydrolase (TIGR01509 family)